MREELEHSPIRPERRFPHPEDDISITEEPTLKDMLEGEGYLKEMGISYTGILEEPRRVYEPTGTGTPLYLRDISSVKLLTSDQEVSFAKTIEKGRFAQETIEQDGFSTEEEREELYQLVDEGKDAKRKLTEANLRLVVSVARKYMGRGVTLDDLIQEGNIGLGRAVERYDYTKGFRFSTYSFWWIRQAVTRAVADQGRTIRIPVHMVDQISDMYRQSRELQQIIGREPTVEEIAEAMQKTPQRVREIIQAARQPISLNTPVGEDEERTVADFVADQNRYIAPDVEATQSLLHDHIKEVLDSLLERERIVLRMRFGLDDGRQQTLGEIGEVLGVSRERIRQIQAEALVKLRNPELRAELKEYLD